MHNRQWMNQYHPTCYYHHCVSAQLKNTSKGCWRYKYCTAFLFFEQKLSLMQLMLYLNIYQVALTTRYIRGLLNNLFALSLILLLNSLLLIFCLILRQSSYFHNIMSVNNGCHTCNDSLFINSIWKHILTLFLNFNKGSNEF